MLILILLFFIYILNIDDTNSKYVYEEYEYVDDGYIFHYWGF